MPEKPAYIPYDPMLAEMPDLEPSSILLRPWDYGPKSRVPTTDPLESPEPPQK